MSDNRDETEEIGHLRALVKEQGQELARLRDDPEQDGTDFAHPAWWRGHEQAVLVMCQTINEVLDGKDDGAGVNYEPWGAVRRRLLKLAQVANAAMGEAAAEEGTLKELTKDHAVADIGNAAYKATCLFEHLERAGKVVGNGHHMRQKCAEFASQLMTERWRENP